MKIASSFNEKPTAIAEKLVESLQENRKIKKVEVVKPGFINFFVSEDSKFLPSLSRAKKVAFVSYICSRAVKLNLALWAACSAIQ